MIEVTLTFEFAPALVERASATLRHVGFAVEPDPAPHDPGIVKVHALVEGDDGNHAVIGLAHLASESLLNDGLTSGICGSFIVIGADTRATDLVQKGARGLRLRRDDEYSAELNQVERSTRWTRTIRQLLDGD